MENNRLYIIVYKLRGNICNDKRFENKFLELANPVKAYYQLTEHYLKMQQPQQQVLYCHPNHQ